MEIVRTRDGPLLTVDSLWKVVSTGSRNVLVLELCWEGGGEGTISCELAENTPDGVRASDAAPRTVESLSDVRAELFDDDNFGSSATKDVTIFFSSCSVSLFGMFSHDQ